MGRPRQEPRLYLDPTRKQWVIRHKNIFKRTGFSEAQIDKAKEMLVRIPQKYKAQLRVRAIYFVTCEGDFPIKIGMSSNVVERMRDIRTALPFEPILLASFQGTSRDERDIHKRFDHLKLRGEWFRRDDDLLAYIEQIRTVLEPIAIQPVPKLESDCA